MKWGVGMKKFMLLFLILILLLILAQINNNNPKAIISKLTKLVDVHEGKLTYRINFLNVIPMADAFFSEKKTEEYNGKRVYHLAASAENLKVYSSLFKGKVTFDSYIDSQDLSPILFKERVSIAGKEDFYKEISYDQKAGIMTIAGIQRLMFSPTQDPLSAVFNIRRMNLEKIKEFEININTNQKNYVLLGKVRPSEITVGDKKYKISIVDAIIKRRDKSPYHKSNISMVIVNDLNNLPILIKVFASGILLNAKLIDIE